MSDVDWADPPCPLFVGASDDPFVCVYDGHPFEAHSPRAVVGSIRTGFSPDEERLAQRLAGH